MPHRRSPDRHHSRQIIRTRVARYKARLEGTDSSWPDGMPKTGDYESAGHYRWRTKLLNLTDKRSKSFDATPTRKSTWVV